MNVRARSAKRVVKGCQRLKVVGSAGRTNVAAAFASMATLELTEENVETVLDEVRPYLMAGMLFTSAFAMQRWASPTKK